MEPTTPALPPDVWSIIARILTLTKNGPKLAAPAAPHSKYNWHESGQFLGVSKSSAGLQIAGSSPESLAFTIW